jgi:AcrR family transcriptional regulator
LSAKGVRSVATILRACVEIMSEQGAAAMSQATVARRAGISQSALRHHFPTKEALLDAVFRGAFDQYRWRVSDILLDPAADAKTKLRRVVEGHFDHIARQSDAYTFEAFAQAARDPGARDQRDAWYAWLIRHYVNLIQQISPHLDAQEAQVRALQVLTLTLGGWITLGRSRPDLLPGGAEAAKAALMGGVYRLLEVDPPPG